MSTKIAGVVAASLLGFLSSTARADSTLYTITPYNVFAIQSFSSSNSDIEGGLAAGAATLNGYEIAKNLIGQSLGAFPGCDTLVTGNLSGSVSLDAGNYYTNRTGTVYNNYNDIQSENNLPTNFSFASQGTTFANLANSLKNLASTDSCKQSGSTVTCSDSGTTGLHVINLASASMLSSGLTLSVTGVSSTAPLIINVGGSSATLTNAISVDGGYADGDDTNAAVDYVLFNFYNASSLTIGSVMGSVLAPNAAVGTYGWGQLDGQLIAKSYTNSGGSTQFESFGYEGSLGATVPEPSSLLLIAAGFALALFTKRRRS